MLLHVVSTAFMARSIVPKSKNSMFASNLGQFHLYKTSALLSFADFHLLSSAKHPQIERHGNHSLFLAALAAAESLIKNNHHNHTAPVPTNRTLPRPAPPCRTQLLCPRAARLPTCLKFHGYANAPSAALFKAVKRPRTVRRRTLSASAVMTRNTDRGESFTSLGENDATRDGGGRSNQHNFANTVFKQLAPPRQATLATYFATSPVLVVDACSRSRERSGK